MLTCSNGQPFDIPFTYETGLDGKRYAVFRDEYDAKTFAEEVLLDKNARLACFNGYFNAVLVEEPK